ncbi:MAG TPA: hypothetical protein VL485_29715 [Ktedonobacteraceae bacterium]|jgi:hypothetical protein|nr:hypothetical protein [Ktedonobacteraceae bacterium]
MKTGTRVFNYTTASGHRDQITVHYFTVGLQVGDELGVLDFLEGNEQWGIMTFTGGTSCRLLAEGRLCGGYYSSTKEAEDEIRQLLDGTAIWSGFKHCNPPRKW